jgi:hypothetical protein
MRRVAGLVEGASILLHSVLWRGGGKLEGRTVNQEARAESLVSARGFHAIMATILSLAVIAGEDRSCAGGWRGLAARVPPQ